MPTSVWSEMARKYAEPIHSEKANDDRRQSVDASQHRCPTEQQCISAAFQYCQVVPRKASASRCAAGRLACLGNRRRPYEGLSRMKGNFQVRFLEGGGLATARLYSA